MITNKGTQTIKTERLILRRFTPCDAREMYENWASDERVTRFLTWQAHNSPKDTKKIVKKWCKDYKNPALYLWAMEFGGKIIGSISVVELDENSERADLGYCMGYAYWNKGIMTEAVSAVIDFLFSEIGVNRIGIRHAVKNPGSGRVAQKCGMAYEGTMREYFKNAAGELLDISFYGILKREWETGNKKGEFK